MADILYAARATDPPGTAYPSLVVETFTSRADAEDARLSYEVIVVSTDGGKTWTEEEKTHG